MRARDPDQGSERPQRAGHIADGLWGLKLALAGAGGALATILAGWAIAVLSNPPQAQPVNYMVTGSDAHAGYTEKRRASEVWMLTRSAAEDGQPVASPPGWANIPEEREVVTTQSFGFPWQSQRRVRLAAWGRPPENRLSLDVKMAGRQYELPIGILPEGFACNTLVYAATLLVVPALLAAGSRRRPRPRQRRAALGVGWRLLAAGAIGAAATYVVAWGCMAWSTVDAPGPVLVASGDDARRSAKDLGMQPPPQPTGPGVWSTSSLTRSDTRGLGLRVSVFEFSSTSRTMPSAAAPRPPAATATTVHRVECSAGWPLRAVASGCRYPAGVVTGGLALPKWFRPDLGSPATRPALPWAIMPSCFAIDAALAALAWLALGDTVTLIRRWARRRSGGCTGCGYDRAGLAADAPCPECGLVR